MSSTVEQARSSDRAAPSVLYVVLVFANIDLIAHVDTLAVISILCFKCASKLIFFYFFTQTGDLIAYKIKLKILVKNS